LLQLSRLNPDRSQRARLAPDYAKRLQQFERADIGSREMSVHGCRRSHNRPALMKRDDAVDLKRDDRLANGQLRKV
jgi:hypothetical protein